MRPACQDYYVIEFIPLQSFENIMMTTFEE